MLNAYSPYIQFIAALYFSMCFEQIIEKYFWNKKYSEKLKNTTEKIALSFCFSENDKKDIEKAIDYKSEKFSMTVRRWAIVGLFSSALILYLLGLEKTGEIDFLSSIITKYFNYFAPVILLPIVFLFLYGLLQTNYHIYKIKHANTKEIEKYEQNMTAIINNDTKNQEYTQMLAKVLNTTNGDTVNKSELLQKISEEFRENAKIRIKSIICGNC